jgi:hypothetical protein
METNEKGSQKSATASSPAANPTRLAAIEQ